MAVTVSNGLQPYPVYVTSVIADPAAAPNNGVSNGNAGNPIANPATTCSNAVGVTVTCTAGIDQGTANTYFLHDWPAGSSGSETAPSANHTTHSTVGTVTGGVCTTVPSLVGTAAQVAGCPQPDLMDGNSPSGTTSTPLYTYSTDQGTSGYSGGRVLQVGTGSGSSSDCSDGGWSTSLGNTQNELWVTPALGSSMTLDGNGGVSIFTQSLNGAAAIVSFCVEIYDVPPSGSSGVADLLADQPVALGGAAYVPPTDPTSGSNWPEANTQMAFTFNFLSGGSPVTVPAGDRIGLRVWAKAEASTPIAVAYDNPNYPAELQLNSQ